MRAESKPGSPRSLIYGLSTALCVLAPFVVFLTANNYPLLAPEIVPLYLVCLLVGLLVAALVKLRLIVLARLALLGFLVLSLAFLYAVQSLPVVITVAVLCGIFVWALGNNAATVVLVAAALHILTTIALGGSDPGSAAPSGVRGPGQASRDLPPVVHLVFDGFSGLRGLPGEVPGGDALRSGLADYYLNGGFELATHAYSQYVDTTDSLPNLFNFTSSATEGLHVRRMDDEVFVLSRNAYFEHVSKLGYELQVYQSTYLDYCSTPNVPVSSCSTYELNSIESIYDIDIPRAQKTLFILNSYLDSSVFLRRARALYYRIRDSVGVPLPPWPSENSRVGPIALLPTLEHLELELRSLRLGEFHFAHLMLPHYPYVLDSDCSIKPKVRTWLNRVPFELHEPGSGVDNTDESRTERYIQYFEQVRCTQDMIERLFAAIRASGQWERAIVVLHGDHGSRISRRWFTEENLPTLREDDYRDGSSTFFAVKKGPSIGRLTTEPLPLQALLSSVWTIPFERSDSHEVYLRTRSGDFRATPLRGFAPLPDLPQTREQ